MRCDRCGAASRVTYTTEQPEQFRTKRRRTCGNNHRFTTYEVHSNVVTCTGKSRVAALTAKAQARVVKYARDLKIHLEHSVRGLTYGQLAGKHGLSRGAIQYICTYMKKERGATPAEKAKDEP